MNAAALAAFGFLSFYLGYRFYSAFLARAVYVTGEELTTPAHSMRDGIDFVPTNPHVLWGHHFTSIAGLAPIVGPAIAVIWGWLPAVLWVVLGTLFIGAVHDFGCLVLSTKNSGRSIADLTGGVLGPRARMLFLLVVFFLAWIVLAVFAWVIAHLFITYPASVFPINIQIVVALTLGLAVMKKGRDLLIPSLIALVMLCGAIGVGVAWPLSIPALFGNEMQTWIVLLLLYCFAVSVLPVWMLLQPRDYINSHLLFLGLGLLYLSVFVLRPPIVAPMINFEVSGAGPWFPFLFITIACGAVSGFHGLVASGTTSKQVDQLQHTRVIGYGGMLGEGSLALMSVLASTAGFASVSAWNDHYLSWSTANKLGPKISAFVDGGAYFLNQGLGLPLSVGAAAAAVIVIAFGATTLDSATRIQRYIIAELGEAYDLPVFTNRFVGAGIAAASPLILVYGDYWKHLWPIFGASNQMLAVLSLLTLTVYLFQRKRPYWATLVPLVLLATITLIAMWLSLMKFVTTGQYLLTGVMAILMSLSAWLLLEGALAMRKLRRGEALAQRPLR